MRWLFLLALTLGVAQASSPLSDVPTDQMVAELKAAQIDDPPLEDPPEDSVAEARTERLSKALRCPVCQGLSVADSPSDAARAMGGRIEELVKLGYTEDQITEYFVDRYGAWVELSPPSEGLHQLLYLAPVLVLIGGLLAVVLVFRQTRAAGTKIAAPPVEPDDELAPYRARILDELGVSS